MSDTTYNGWSNYPTWNWKLWIDNDEGSCEYWQERARECYSGSDTDDEAVADLASELEAEASERMSEAAGVTGPIADILGWAMDHVDYREIAESMIGDIDDDERAELRPKDDDEAEA